MSKKDIKELEKEIAGATSFTKYEDVKNQKTEEYFKNNQFSIDAFRKKYALIEKPDETYVQALKRVCDFVASVEKTEELKEYWSKRWFHEIYNDWWHPAGSIMQGAGNGRKSSLANCFSVETEFITDKGVKSFKDFKDGESVNVLTNKGSYNQASVRKFGNQRLYKLTMQKHSIIKEVFCTSNHIWRTVIDQGTILEKETKDLNEGDKLSYIKRKWMPCKIGSRYYCPIGWIHGFVFGDGDYYKENDSCRAFLCGDSREILKLFSGFNWSIKNEDDKDVVQYLPKWMKALPDFNKENEDYMLGFIIGYFAADGTVDSDGRASISSANPENLHAIKRFGEAIGIYTSDIKLTRNESPFDGNAEHKLYRINIFKDCLFDSFFTKESHKKNWENYKSNKINDKLNAQWKVISVEETDRVEDVWCVVVPEIENFTLQGGVNTHNCNTISLGALREDEEWDNLESIFRNTGYTVAKSAAYRQGIGVDFSRLRPRGSNVLNSANKSTGAIHWMKFIDSIGYVVGQSGRIPAMLFSLSCKHPDVEEFIKSKHDRKTIQNANISVQCTDDFYEAVKKDKDWDLTFTIPEIKKGQKVYVDALSATPDCKKDDKGHYYIASHDRKQEVIKKTVKAKELMVLIAKNMYENAEPGIQNIDMARKYSNSDYVYDSNDVHDSRIISTNACSEQYLSRESLCILSSINCARFDTILEKYEKEMEIICPSITRFLDNVNECELKHATYATENQRQAIQKLRRVGAGVTNIAGWLFAQNIAYATDKSADVLDKFAERYAYHLYKSSIELGHEKGSFGLFNKEKIEKAPFIKRMKKLGLEFDALRNITLVSIAPSGTLSLMFRDLVMSYGIEPAFGLYYWKRTRMCGKYEYYFNVPHIVREVFKKANLTIPMESDTIKDDWQGSKGKKIAEFIDANKSKIGLEFRSATDIKCKDKLEMMSRIMKWVDSSISVTYMLPETSKWEEVYEFIMMAYEKEVKSIAVYTDKKMYGVISFTPFKDLAFKFKNENVFVDPQNFDPEELKALNMTVGELNVDCKNAPKRPQTLEADIYSITVNKEKFVIAIGKYNGYPYEVFGGKMKGLSLDLDAKHVEGKIIKVSRGVYALEFEETVIKDFSKQFTPFEKIMFRSLSTMLRHGIPLEHIVDQLNKASDDMFSMSAAVVRVLKKYIKNGQKATGSSCPNCGGPLFYFDGCVQCSCGYSGCS